MPAGGGQIGSWSANVTGATPGTALTLLLLRGAGSGYAIAAFDGETVPSPLPASGIATFNLPHPILVNGGEVLGLYGSATTVACYFAGSSLSESDMLSAGAALAPPSIGGTYTSSVSAAKILLNASAELAQSLDLGVTGAANPATITAGGTSAYVFTVTNGGVSAGPVTFTDGLPGGLNVLTAVAGAGSCTTAGQLVNCTIPSLEGGASVPVVIVVSAPGAGSYPDTATVSTSSPIGDGNPANNAATATLAVNAPPAPPSAAPAPCKLIRLAGLPLATAKSVIAALGCRAGKVTSKSSRSVRKGLVISTSPGAGATLPAGAAVNVVVSAGPPRKRHKKR